MDGLREVLQRILEVVQRCPPDGAGVALCRVKEIAQEALETLRPDAGVQLAVAAERERCAAIARQLQRNDPAHPIGPEDHAVRWQHAAAKAIELAILGGKPGVGPDGTEAPIPCPREPCVYELRLGDRVEVIPATSAHHLSSLLSAQGWAASVVNGGDAVQCPGLVWWRRWPRDLYYSTNPGPPSEGASRPRPHCGTALRDSTPPIFREVPVTRRVRLEPLGKALGVKDVPGQQASRLELDRPPPDGLRAPGYVWATAYPDAAGRKERVRLIAVEQTILDQVILVEAEGGRPCVTTGDWLWLEVDDPRMPG